MSEFGGWESVMGAVRERIGEPAFQAWFKGLRGELSGGTLVVRCPDRFSLDWIRSRYGSTVADVAGGVTAIEYCVDRNDSESPAERGPAARPQASADASARASAAGPSNPRRSEPCFDSFVAGPGNALALEAARAIARGEAGQCNPLVLSAGSGLGKTHLCRAMLASLRRSRPEGTLYRSSEQFTTEVTQAIRSSQMPEVRHRYRRSANVLILEDVQFLEGKRATQIELFHTLDHLIEAGRSVVITSDRAPHELTGLDASLRSRIHSGFVAHIAPPDLETRLRILRERAAGGGVRLPEVAYEVLAARPVESVRDLLSGLNQVVARASLLRQPVTLELVREALATLPVPGPIWSLDEILERTARAYGTQVEELRGRSRRRRVVQPRQFAMYLCRRLTDASLVEIGRLLGRDHTTVLHAIDAVERRIVERPQLRYELEAITAPFRAG